MPCVDHQVLIRRPCAEIYRWLESSLVDWLGGHAAGPCPLPFALTTDMSLAQAVELLDAVPDRLLAWRCHDGLVHAGVLRLEPIEPGLTRLSLTITAPEPARVQAHALPSVTC